MFFCRRATTLSVEIEQRVSEATRECHSPFASTLRWTRHRAGDLLVHFASPLSADDRILAEFLWGTAANGVGARSWGHWGILRLSRDLSRLPRQPAGPMVQHLEREEWSVPEFERNFYRYFLDADDVGPLL